MPAVKSRGTFQRHNKKKKGVRQRESDEKSMLVVWLNVSTYCTKVLDKPW